MANTASVTVWGIVHQLMMVLYGVNDNVRSFDDYNGGLRHLQQWSSAIDHSWAQRGLWVFFATCLCVSLWPKNSSSQAERGVVATCFACCVAGLWALPYHTEGTLGGSILLNIRWLCLTPWLAALLTARQRMLRHPDVRAIVYGLMVISAMWTLTGVTRLSRAYDDGIRSFRQAIGRILRGSRLGMWNETVRVGEPWPSSVRFNMGFMAFPERLVMQSGLFVAGHIPLREQIPGEQARLESMAHTYLTVLQRNDWADPVVQDFWQSANILSLLSPSLDSVTAVYPAMGELLARGRGWLLVGPPSGVVACMDSGQSCFSQKDM